MRARFAAAPLLALAATTAGAHPVDEIVEAAYLGVEPGGIRLEFDVSPGSAVAALVLRDLDRDGDRRVTPAEARAYATRVLSLLHLTVDGAPLAWRFDQAGVPPYANLAGQADTVRIFAAASTVPRGEHVIAFGNAYRPCASVVMTNIFPRDGSGWRYRVVGQGRSDDGRLYTARLIVTTP